MQNVDRHLGIWTSTMSNGAGMALMAGPLAFPQLDALLFFGIGTVVFVVGSIVTSFLLIKGRAKVKERTQKSVLLPLLVMGLGVVIFTAGAIWLYAKDSANKIPLPQTEHASASPPPQGPVGFDIQAPFSGNVLKLRTSGIENVLRSTAPMENNSIDIRSRKDNGPVDDFPLTPVDKRAALKAATLPQLSTNIGLMTTTLHNMEKDVKGKIPDLPAAIAALSKNNTEFNNHYAENARDIESTLLDRLNEKYYPRERPTLLSDGIAAGIRPFDDLAAYLADLLDKTQRMAVKDH